MRGERAEVLIRQLENTLVDFFCLDSCRQAIALVIRPRQGSLFRTATLISRMPNAVTRRLHCLTNWRSSETTLHSKKIEKRGDK
jgi:hypothetical protein